MPLINVKIIEDVFTEAQKAEMVTKLTDAMVSIEGENMRSVTWVVVEEVKSGDWGIGGSPDHRGREGSGSGLTADGVTWCGRSRRRDRPPPHGTIFEDGAFAERVAVDVSAGRSP
ncbi:tautomerase family protein [Nonomuraea recticatena]|uniref:tautomerase family protein n=1 Tax=Nonomuraea recticatena TaxID=46178 RepID=UPI00360E6893